MAEQEINLIPDAELGGSIAKKRSNAIATFTVVILLAFLIIFGVVFFFYFRSNRTLNDIRSQKEPLEQDIKQLSTKEGLVRVIAAKVDALQSIQSSQPKFKDIVQALLVLQQPSSTAYSELSLTAPNKVLITGRATTIDSLESFLYDLTAKEYGRKNFQDIALQSLTRGEDGEYEFSLRFTYADK